MHRLQRLNPIRTRGRGWRALVLTVSVVLAHVLVLQFAVRVPKAAPRAPVIELRRLALTTPTPEPTAAAVQPVSDSQPAKPAARRQRPAAAGTPSTHTQPAPSIEAPHAPPPAFDPPTAPPPTRAPASAELVFTLQRGAQSGEARLAWRSDGARYTLSLLATLPSGRELEQHSEGGFDAAGLAPLRLADRRRGRDVRAANFQREHGKVTFSGPRWELPLEQGTQDRLSWLVQLVALIGGADAALREGSELAMWVVGARGAASHWRFEVRGRERLLLADGTPVDAWQLVREPMHPYDLRVEVWLSGQQGHWPIRLRQTQIPGGEPLEWSLRQHASIEPGT